MSKSTEIVVILDQSGSMNAIKDDAIGGFNEFLAAQKKEPGEARLTLVLFDSANYTERYISQPLQCVQPLDDNTYNPGASTPLWDAIGNTVKRVQERLAERETPRQGHEDARKMEGAEEGDEPVEERVIVAILTDGQENASREFTKSGIAALLKEQQDKGWAVLFLAANMDAAHEGGAMGIQACNTSDWSGAKGLRCAYLSASDAVRNYRSGGSGTLRDADES